MERIKEMIDDVTNNYPLRKAAVVRGVCYNIDNFEYLDGLKIIVSAS